MFKLQCCPKEEEEEKKNSMTGTGLSIKSSERQNFLVE
jgi:hypothetical protein